MAQEGIAGATLGLGRGSLRCRDGVCAGGVFSCQTCALPRQARRHGVFVVRIWCGYAEMVEQVIVEQSSLGRCATRVHRRGRWVTQGFCFSTKLAMMEGVVVKVVNIYCVSVGGGVYCGRQSMR